MSNPIQSVSLFGSLVWDWIRNQGGSFTGSECSEDLLTLAEKAGLCQRVKYDPAVHGEGIKADPGAEIWWWGDAPPCPNQKTPPWTIFQGATWAVMLPNGDSLDRFTTEAAAISARAHLRPMWAALVEPPADIYEAFHTDGKGWGFFDREGNLHAEFPSRNDAQGCAARREDADYSTPAT